MAVRRATRFRKLGLAEAMTLILEGKPLIDWPDFRCLHCGLSLHVHDCTPCDVIPRCDCGRAMGSLCNGCGRYAEGRKEGPIDAPPGHYHALPNLCPRCTEAELEGTVGTA